MSQLWVGEGEPLRGRKAAVVKADYETECGNTIPMEENLGSPQNMTVVVCVALSAFWERTRVKCKHLHWFDSSASLPGRVVCTVVGADRRRCGPEAADHCQHVHHRRDLGTEGERTEHGVAGGEEADGLRMTKLKGGWRQGKGALEKHQDDGNRLQLCVSACSRRLNRRLRCHESGN